VTSGQKLSTWCIQGDHLGEFSHRLQNQPGIDQTVVFGSALHVTGHDAAMLERTVATAAAEAGLRAERIDTGIEDVFIYLMNKADATKVATQS
jgi:ABC-2 type transport system ATP-binding protein